MQSLGQEDLEEEDLGPGLNITINIFYIMDGYIIFINVKVYTFYRAIGPNGQAGDDVHVGVVKKCGDGGRGQIETSLLQQAIEFVGGVKTDRVA